MSSEGAKMPHGDHRRSSSGNSKERKRPAQTSHGSPGRGQINPAPRELRLVLLGKTGAGKSATGNSILGNQRFDDGLSMSSVTKECKRERAAVEERELVLVDTPGCFDTDLTDEELQREVIHCLALCSPGPHAFLLVVPIERFTEEQQRTVEMILEMFHEDVTPHIILIFSHADRLRGQSIEDFISTQDQKVQELVERFGRRFVAFDNTNPTKRDQVRRLLQRVDNLLARYENQHFTCPITEVMQEAQKIIEEKTQADMAEMMKKIEKEVGKLADKRWHSFNLLTNKERHTERKRKRIQSRIDQIKMDIKKEKQNVRPIPARLKRFRASLERERENMRRLEERERAERKERKEIEKNNLKIWKEKEEQRRLRKEGKNKGPPSKMELLIKLCKFLRGVGVQFAPELLAFLYPDAPAVKDGSSAMVLAKLLGVQAVESMSLFWTAIGAARKTADWLATRRHCSIQ